MEEENGLVTLKKIGGVFVVPFGDLLFSFFMGDAMTLFDFAQKLFALSGNHVQVVICQLAPLLLDFAFELHPVAFYGVFVHGVVLKNVDKTSSAQWPSGETTTIN